MFKNLLHLTLLTLLWKRYKRLIISTLILFVYFWLVGKLHEDYVDYVELNENQQFLALSFLLKWLAFTFGAVIYLLLNVLIIRGNRPTSAQTGAADSSSTDSKPKAKDADPFAQIRQRKKLRSRADFLIEKHHK